MISKKSISGIFFCLLAFTSMPAVAFDWATARGFNVTPNVSDADLEYIASVGCSVIRVSFGDSPLLSLTGAYESNEATFKKLDHIIEVAKKNHLVVVIDPHALPGFKNRYTTSPHDLFWSSDLLQNRLKSLWVEIAQRYRSDDQAVLGFDLLNEPVTAVPSADNNYFDWNKFVESLVKVIRVSNKTAYIVIEPARQLNALGGYDSFFSALSRLKLPRTDRMVVSPHMYTPMELTHEGVLPQFSAAVHYPGKISGEQWDAKKIQTTLVVARQYGDANHVPIFIGEFSASVISGDDGDRYLADLLDVMDQLSFGWAFHAFKENPVWNPQQATLRMASNGRTVRMNTITSALKNK
ncbi:MULTISPECIES: glycoside hydrolase family 5 protein [Paraburkholderia]|uniref:glycoside hydrolase family 5 protein n=1 Tax=Paraburkholderia TaxID=1822464 RepID=UPI00224E8449|nr:MULTISPECIES: cellulase family glycosylhydrolase [Paraburkholderia]MCX4172735.1 cellulase family glycosylhydrolase [Paraburkholderia madseniana]MDQ6460743.1 glycoside hydrolase family 5 protein [Paraburkholderia madseniana]